MNKEILKKAGIITASILAGVYVLFLVLPLFLGGIANSCGHYLTKVIEDASGFKVRFENVRFTTTPKLTAGVKIGHISAITPDNYNFLTIDNAFGKISLIPLLARKIEIDSIGAEKISTDLKVKKNGKFQLEDYIPAQNQQKETEEVSAPVTELPLGLKLSNKLPDIHINEYKIALIDMPTEKRYYVQGENLSVKDFIINKQFKIATNGKIVLDDKTPFNYDIKIFNKIMPDISLNDLVFAPQKEEIETKNTDIQINPIDIFKTIYKNELTTDIKTDITTEGSLDDINLHGLINAQNISLAVNGTPLPQGHVLINMKGKNIDINSAVYTANNEETSLNGVIKTGKNPHINITCKSNAQLNNIIKVFDSIAKSVNIKDLDTLSATGAIDADFTINAGMKKVESSGYFKIPQASVKYGLYNVLIDKISTDIDFSNNMINLKNIGFSILNQPLKAYGTIKQDTSTDLHLTADKLPVKGLITAAGQTSLLKDNNIKSGVLSLDASVKGKLKEATPKVNLSIDNLNIHNKPSTTSVKLSDAKLNISSDGKTFKGIVDVNSVNIINPMATLALPKAKVTLNEKDVLIDNTYLTFNNSKVDISGKIKDYTSKKPTIDINAKGGLLSSDIRSMIPADLRKDILSKGTLPLYVKITGDAKTQNITLQLLATPSNYLQITNVNQLQGKSTLINSNIKISNDTLKLYDTGVFAVNGLSSLPASAFSGNILSVTGSVENLSSKQILNGITIKTPSAITAGIPGFKNSNVTAAANITLNGNALNPKISGNVNIPTISIPTIKTTLKNTTVDLGANAITVNTPSINIDNSVMNAKIIINPNFNNGIIINNVTYHAVLLDTDTLIKAMEGMPAQSPTSAATSAKPASATSADLGVIIRHGKGTVNKFKSGGIIATDLTSDFNLANNTLYLKNLQGNAFDGKVNGNIAVNLVNGKTNVDFHGSNMNATKAVEGAAGLKNALSGNLGFNAKLNLNTFAPSQNALMQSIKGDIDFAVKNGTLGNIGRLENLLFAENLVSNGVIAAALTPITNMPVVKNTAIFESITGDMTLNNGSANIKYIKTSGPSMATFVYGKYNIINASANLTILGRLGADVVAALGPVGDFSVSKLTSYIPKFGALTGKLLSAITTNPKGERTSEIPALSTGNTNYKDFKVSFNGGVESKSSVKYFKWLSVCDTSEIEGGSLKEQYQQSQEDLRKQREERREAVKQDIEDVKNAAKQSAEDIKNQIQNTKDSINELKNLFKKPQPAEEPAVPASAN